VGSVKDGISFTEKISEGKKLVAYPQFWTGPHYQKLHYSMLCIHPNKKMADLIFHGK
jgi:hypothetical protein